MKLYLLNGFTIFRPKVRVRLPTIDNDTELRHDYDRREWTTTFPPIKLLQITDVV